MSRKVVLVSCVKSKINRPAQAKDLYDSTLFRAQRNYAEAVGDAWFILSAKYGLLHPEAEIEPYEETLKGASTAKKRKWSAGIFGELEKRTKPNDTIIITAGEDYCRHLEPLIRQRGNEVVRPVKGLSMGYIPGRLRELTRESGEASTRPLKQPMELIHKGPSHRPPVRPRGDSQIPEFYRQIQ